MGECNATKHSCAAFEGTHDETNQSGAISCEKKSRTGVQSEVQRRLERRVCTEKIVPRQPQCSDFDSDQEAGAAAEPKPVVGLAAENKDHSRTAPLAEPGKLQMAFNKKQPLQTKTKCGEQSVRVRSRFRAELLSTHPFQSCLLLAKNGPLKRTFSDRVWYKCDATLRKTA